MEFLRVYSSQDLAELPANSWGIREPPETWQGQHRSKGACFRIAVCALFKFKKLVDGGLLSFDLLFSARSATYTRVFIYR